MLVRRNCKLFFRDKGMFFTSLITPMILLVLYATFLGNIYKDTFSQNFGGIAIEEKLVSAIVGGQLISSLLSVCCVTVAFCSGLLMIQDRVTGAVRDITVSPVKKSSLALSYLAATEISTLIICLSALALCLAYLATLGWYLSVADVLFLIVDVIALTLMGSSLCCLICIPLTTSGQASAVGTIISSVYGFICGAYMPISTFSDGLQKILSFLPGTYATSLFRTHAMNSALEEVAKSGVPTSAINSIRDGVNVNAYFFDNAVPTSVMLLIVGGSAILLSGIYVVISCKAKKYRT